jgi:hypothetical protein
VKGLRRVDSHAIYHKTHPLDRGGVVNRPGDLKPRDPGGVAVLLCNIGGLFDAGAVADAVLTPMLSLLRSFAACYPR